VRVCIIGFGLTIAAIAPGGWNVEEMEDHGTVYETRTLKMREQIEAMKEIWVPFC